jgi:acyl-coenzyme A thioesterase PaaI-like protein
MPPSPPSRAGARSPFAASSTPFSDIFERYAGHPAPLRRPLVTHAVGKVIPFVATAGCFVEAYTPTRVAVSLDDRAAVHNHIGGLHAAALSLLAETASGLVVALNVPDGSVPVPRSMTVDFQRRAAGRVTAEATLAEEEAAGIRERPVGKIEVALSIEDADGRAPVASTLEWAWLPESKL